LLAYQRVDTAEARRRCIKELNRFVPRLDLVVIFRTADLVDAPIQASVRPPRGAVIAAAREYGEKYFDGLREYGYGGRRLKCATIPWETGSQSVSLWHPR